MPLWPCISGRTWVKTCMRVMFIQVKNGVPASFWRCMKSIAAGYPTMCGNLTRVLGDRDLQLHYEPPAIHEVIVEGDLAVVRLTWTITVTVGGETETTDKEGMDVSGGSRTGASRSRATSRSRRHRSGCSGSGRRRRGARATSCSGVAVNHRRSSGGLMSRNIRRSARS